MLSRIARVDTGKDRAELSCSTWLITSGCCCVCDIAKAGFEFLLNFSHDPTWQSTAENFVGQCLAANNLFYGSSEISPTTTGSWRRRGWPCDRGILSVDSREMVGATEIVNFPTSVVCVVQCNGTDSPVRSLEINVTWVSDSARFRRGSLLSEDRLMAIDVSCMESDGV